MLTTPRYDMLMLMIRHYAGDSALRARAHDTRVIMREQRYAVTCPRLFRSRHLLHAFISAFATRRPHYFFAPHHTFAFDTPCRSLPDYFSAMLLPPMSFFAIDAMLPIRLIRLRQQRRGSAAHAAQGAAAVCAKRCAKICAQGVRAPRKRCARCGEARWYA